MLEDYPWKKSDEKIVKSAFDMYLTTHFNLNNWNKINSEFSNTKEWESLIWRHKYIVATSLIRGDFANKTSGMEAKKISADICKNLIQKAPSPWSYKAVLINAERLISENNYQKADKLLSKEKTNPDRLDDSGTLLFWMALVSLFEERYSRADSLLVLATSYINEDHTSRALEIRNWLIMDTLSSNRKAFFKGLKEAGLNSGQKLTSLAKIPQNSPLWPHARFEMAGLFQHNGKSDSALVLLKSISSKSKDTWMAFNSHAIANFKEEEFKKYAMSIAIYNDILVKYQQGVISEFSRERIKALKMKVMK